MAWECGEGHAGAGTKITGRSSVDREAGFVQRYIHPEAAGVDTRRILDRHGCDLGFVWGRRARASAGRRFFFFVWGKGGSRRESNLEKSWELELQLKLRLELELQLRQMRDLVALANPLPVILHHHQSSVQGAGATSTNPASKHLQLGDHPELPLLTTPTADDHQDCSSSGSSN